VINRYKPELGNRHAVPSLTPFLGNRQSDGLWEGGHLLHGLVARYFSESRVTDCVPSWWDKAGH
jgi:hypothetical protein